MTKSFKIRDRRSKGWFYLDNDYLNGYAKVFGAVGTAVYVSLCRHADNDTQKCFPSMELMAEELAVSRNTISKYIKLFEDYRIIAIERERDEKTKKWLNNSYYLLNKTEWILHAQSLGMDSHAQPLREPCTNDSDSHAQPLGNKETHINYTHIKETHIAKQASQDISSVIKEMEMIDPKNKLYYGNKTQREACRFLIEEYSLESVLSAVNFYINARRAKVKYLPTITTPCNLRDKWQQLLMLIERKHAELEEVKNNFI